MADAPDILILAAGCGTRMKSRLPKVLHLLQGKPLIQHVLEHVAPLAGGRLGVVVGFGEKEVRDLVGKISPRAFFIRQSKQQGTGHAVSCAEKSGFGSSKNLMILAGDAPFLMWSTLTELIKKHRTTSADVSILSARVQDPKGYGRVVRTRNGQVTRIREELDANDKERRIQEINSGAYIFNRKLLFETLRKIEAENKKREYYLTDTVEVLAAAGKKVQAYALASEEEVMGINSRKDLILAHERLNQKTIDGLLERGVTVLSPRNTFIAPDVKVGADTVIYPFSYIESRVIIGKGCHVGPFAFIRDGSRIEDGARIGSFVEVVRSRIGKRTMVKHLSYVGDSLVGDEVNIGAGTITANYDGKEKHKTVIEDGAFIGSNTVLVAPVKVGKRAKTGAGSVVLASKNVLEGTTVVGIPARTLRSGRLRKS